MRAIREQERRLMSSGQRSGSSLMGEKHNHNSLHFTRKNPHFKFDVLVNNMIGPTSSPLPAPVMLLMESHNELVIYVSILG